MQQSAYDTPSSLISRPITKGTEMWRHWVPGVESTQLTVQGAIPRRGLFDLSRGRLVRGLPQYMYDVFRANVWFQRVLALWGTFSHVSPSVSDDFLQFLDEQTPTCREDLRSLAQTQTLIIKRCRLLMKHNAELHHRFNSATGIRPVFAPPNPEVLDLAQEILSSFRETSLPLATLLLASLASARCAKALLTVHELFDVFCLPSAWRLSRLQFE
eukprot:5754765-Amphidinium_carterae.1